MLNTDDIFPRSVLKPITLDFDPAPGPITSTVFNRTGSILAYSVCYDWHKGHTGMTPDQPVKIMLHAVKDDEAKRKPPK